MCFAYFGCLFGLLCCRLFCLVFLFDVSFVCMCCLVLRLLGVLFVVLLWLCCHDWFGRVGFFCFLVVCIGVHMFCVVCFVGFCLTCVCVVVVLYMFVVLFCGILFLLCYHVVVFV